MMKNTLAFITNILIILLYVKCLYGYEGDEPKNFENVANSNYTKLKFDTESQQPNKSLTTDTEGPKTSSNNCTCETESVLVNATIHGDPPNVTTEIWCPVYNDCCSNIVEGLSYWLEGVIQVTLAIIGILMNLASCCILGSKEMRNAFNLLLIALCLFDSGYLLGAILESFRKSFKLASYVHIYLFPYLLYPFHMIFMSASIFMTVAIAMERYVAVHYPIDYNQAMNDEHANVFRLLKYVVPVFTFALVFNVPKFLEATIVHDNRTGDPNKPFLHVTELRLDPDYAIYYNNWTRLAILGIIPAVMLVFFNAKIYQDIRARRARRRPQNPLPSASRTAANGGTVLTKETHAKLSKAEFTCANSRSSFQDDNTKPLLTIPEPQRKNSSLSVPESMAGKISNRMTNFRPSKKVSTSNTENRRQKEDNLAVIFMGIVIVFLVCHFPRIFLSLHEMLVIRNTMACSRVGYYSFPLWALLFAQFSHILLVLNSSMNSVIYCMVSSKYREQALKYLHIVKSACGRSCIFTPFRRVILWCQRFCTKSEIETSQNINNNVGSGIQPGEEEIRQRQCIDMTHCQRTPKGLDKIPTIRHNGNSDQEIELSAISGEKSCNASRDGINSSSSPVAASRNGTGHSINNDSISNKNVSDEAHTRNISSKGSTTENNFHESSNCNQESNETLEPMKTTNYTENGEVNQNSSMMSNNMILTSNLSKMENVKNSLTQITQV